jgi:hypothetical protein
MSKSRPVPNCPQKPSLHVGIHAEQADSPDNIGMPSALTLTDRQKVTIK